MDTHDKQFDNWMRESLEVEIPLSKHTKHSAWEAILLKANVSEPILTSVYTPIPTTNKFLLAQLWNEILRFVTQEKTYHEARAKAGRNCLTQSNYYGGLSLHNMELMRQRWAFPV